MAAASAPWAVTVALASGRAVELQLRDDERGASAVRALASRALGVRVAALLTEDGRRLPEGAALPDLGLGGGAVLTAVVEPVVVHASPRNPVFLAVVGGRLLASWGDVMAGGDSSSVRAELEGAVVEKVCATNSALAVLSADGKVITWGARECLSDAEGVRAQLQSGVRGLYANRVSFVAVSDSGRVVATWGHDSVGEFTRGFPFLQVQAELQEGVRDICATVHAFAAVKEDGRVVTWGHGRSGGSSEHVRESLSRDVVCVSATNHAFAALRKDGTVVTWGDVAYSADSSAAEPYLRDVRQVVSGSRAFAALTGSGDMVAWAAPPVWDEEEGDYVNARKLWREEGVLQVCLTDAAAAVLRADGTVKAWGLLGGGGDEDKDEWAAPAQGLSGVRRLCSASSSAFAAVLLRCAAGGGGGGAAAVVSWGRTLDRNGPFWREDVRVELDVEGVYSTAAAFAAILSGGKVVAWGDAGRGGDCSGVQAELESDVVHIASNTSAFAAVKASGEVVTWGRERSGGDSSALAALLRPLST